METTKSLVAMRVRAELKAGKSPGPGGSLGKLAGSVIQWRFREIAMEIAGAGSQAWDRDDEKAGERQRDIIGDRVLGLPRELSVDTTVPFKDA